MVHLYGDTKLHILMVHALQYCCACTRTHTHAQIQWLLAWECPCAHAYSTGGTGLGLFPGGGGDPQLHPPREYPALHGCLSGHDWWNARHHDEVCDVAANIVCSFCHLTFALIG